MLKKGRGLIYKRPPDGGELTLAVLQSRTVFGEMSLTAQRLRKAYAEAVETSDITTMCRADVGRLILDKPKVGLRVVHLLGERLYNYETRMECLGLREVPARLANLTLVLIESEGVRNAHALQDTHPLHPPSVGRHDRSQPLGIGESSKAHRLCAAKSGSLLCFPPTNSYSISYRQ